MSIASSNPRIGLLNVILNHITSRGWKNYDDFVEEFVDRILLSFRRENYDVKAILSKSPSTFFRLNHMTKESFLTPELIKKIEATWKREVVPVLGFDHIFPEIKKMREKDVPALLDRIAIPEREIQDALRKALRSKGASPIPTRGKDSPLEIADIEHFKMAIDGRSLTFAAIVKGYYSIRKERMSWEDVAHQVTKAYDSTRPDHLLLLTAKEPKDSVVTHLVQYSQSVGKPNLIILVPPPDLARFLKAFGVI